MLAGKTFLFNEGTAPAPVDPEKIDRQIAAWLTSVGGTYVSHTVSVTNDADPNCDVHYHTYVCLTYDAPDK